MISHSPLSESFNTSTASLPASERADARAPTVTPDVLSQGNAAESSSRLHHQRSAELVARRVRQQDAQNLKKEKDLAKQSLVQTVKECVERKGLSGLDDFIAAVQAYHGLVSQDKKWREEHERHRAKSVSSTSNFRIDMTDALAVYMGRNDPYSDENFHRLYDTVVAYVGSREADAVQESTEGQVSQAATASAESAEAASSIVPPVMRSMPSSDIVDLLSQVRSPDFKQRFLGGAGEPRSIPIRDLAARLHKSELEDLVDRDYVVTGLALAIPTMDERDQEAALTLIGNYLVPDKDDASLPHAVSQALTSKRPDLILTNDARFVAMNSLLAAGNAFGILRWPKVLTMGLRIYTALAKEITPRQRIKLLGQMLEAVARNDTSLRKTYERHSRLFAPWKSAQNQVIYKFTGEIDGFLKTAEDIYRRESLNSEGISEELAESVRVVEQAVSPMQPMLAHFTSRIEPAGMSIKEFLEPILKRSKAMIGIEKFLAGQKKSLQDLAYQLPPRELEDGSFPGVRFTNGTSRLDEHYLQQSWRDEILVVKDMKENLEAYADVLGQKEDLDHAWENANISVELPQGESDPDGSIVARRREIRGEGIKALSALPELQDKLDALRRIEPDLPNPVLHLLNKEPALLDDIWKNRVFALAYKRAEESGKVERLPKAL